jgi:hypothetical protein
LLLFLGCCCCCEEFWVPIDNRQSSTAKRSSENPNPLAPIPAKKKQKNLQKWVLGIGPPETFSKFLGLNAVCREMRVNTYDDVPDQVLISCMSLGSSFLDTRKKERTILWLAFSS